MSRRIDADAERDAVFGATGPKRQAYFLAFHAGRRLCLGKTMAMVEAKNCIATLLRNNIDFELVDKNDDLRNWNVFTAMPVISYRNGVLVNVIKGTN